MGSINTIYSSILSGVRVEPGKGFISAIKELQTVLRSKTSRTESENSFLALNANEFGNKIQQEFKRALQENDEVNLDGDFLTVSRNGQEIFRTKIIEPSSEAPQSVSAKPSSEDSFVVMLDPGHGSKKKKDNGDVVFDSGAKIILGDGTEITEEQLVEDFTIKVLKPKLEQAGFEVMLSREGNLELEDLNQRIVRMNKSINENAIVLSIHANSGRKNVRGFDVFYDGAPDKVLASDIAESILVSRDGSLKDLQVHGKGARPDFESGKDRLAICRDLNCPSALLELSFMTNPSDLTLLRSSDAMNQYADAIVVGIVQYSDRQGN